MSEDVQQIESEDDEITEEWLRETDEPEIRGVGASYTDEGGWIVDIWAQEFFRQDPLGIEGTTARPGSSTRGQWCHARGRAR